MVTESSRMIRICSTQQPVPTKYTIKSKYGTLGFDTSINQLEYCITHNGLKILSVFQLEFEMIVGTSITIFTGLVKHSNYYFKNHISSNAIEKSGHNICLNISESSLGQ
jgi:hypothetical protein